ncbi:MAG: hypothetical protein ACTHK4_10025 [Mycobacteriales bacterium]
MSDDSARLARGLTIALVVVSVLHALSAVALRGIHSGYGWDETVYISQIDPHAVASVFSAPRSRGLTLLTAPAALISPSIALMRLWLALLSGIGMFLAFLPWLRVRRSAVVPVAALMWSGLWVAIYYSFEAMPNQYVAYGALAATGWLLVAINQPEQRRAIWYAAALAFTALIRPSDAVFAFVALVATVFLVHNQSRRWRLTAGSALTAGLVAGMAEWVIEAFVRFGGPVARLHAASRENGGGLHFSIAPQMRVLGGPLLCRRGCHVDASQAARAWWYLGLVLVIVGVVTALRARSGMAYVVATAVGLALALEYFIALGYGAPRFLEPAYALLALPAAEGVAWVWRHATGAARPLAIAVALVLVAGLEANQIHYLQRADAHQARNARNDRTIARYIRSQHLPHPCFVGGIDAGPVGFLSDCHALGLNPPNPTAHPTGTLIFIREHPHPVRNQVATWQKHTIHAPAAAGFTVWWLVEPAALP